MQQSATLGAEQPPLGHGHIARRGEPLDRWASSSNFIGKRVLGVIGPEHGC